MNPVCFSIMLLAIMAVSACSVQTARYEETRIPPAVDSANILTRQIDSLLQDTLLRPALIGIQILSLEDQKLLYSFNSEKLFHPASNMKLLTTATGLHILGTTFQFRTDFLTDGKVANGELRGNLYVKSFGDPLLTTSDLDSVAKQLAAKGIQRITGNLVGDRRYFDTLSWGKGWMWDDEPEADEAFISPLTVNANAISIEIHPGNQINTPASVTVEPPTSYVEIRNSSTTSTDSLIAPLAVSRRHGENIIHIEGRISPGNSIRKFLVSVWQPENYFLHLLRERLRLQSISLQTDNRIDSSRGTIELYTLSHPMDSVIHQINKSSDNIAAENLLKTISAKRWGAPGSSTRGLTCMKEYLDSLGIDTTKMNLADGSGVSWYNTISPGAMVQLLNKQYADRGTFNHFYESLPIAGIDGTLKNRLIGTRAEGKVRAKTGTLTGESCLSGYVTTADNKLLAFSFLFNHFPGETSHLRSVQDKILNLLTMYDTRTK